MQRVNNLAITPPRPPVAKGKSIASLVVVVVVVVVGVGGLA